MADRGTNIDIVFRNGLRDYEVLPPAGTWDSIRPAIRKRQRPVLLLRSAAMIAVLISLGFLVYKWNISISDKLANLQYTLNPESEYAILNVRKETPLTEALIPVIARNEQAITYQDNSSQAVIPVTEVADATPASLPQTGDNTDRLAGNNDSRADRLFAAKTPYKIKLNPDPYSLPVGNETEQKQSNGKWSVAALLSPTYFSGFNTTDNTLTGIIESKEKPVISYTGGVAFAYKVSKRLSVQSGLYFSSLGNQLSGINSFSGFESYDRTKGDHNFEILTTNGTVHTTSSDVYLMDKISTVRVKTVYTADVFDPGKANLTYINNSLTQNFSYLELPLFLKYKFIDRVVDFNLIGGLSSNFLVNNAVYANSSGSRMKVGTTDGMSPVTFSSSLGMGMEYSFSKNISINLEPTFNYYINPFTGSQDIRLHPYSFGIFSGLSYKF